MSRLVLELESFFVEGGAVFLETASADARLRGNLVRVGRKAGHRRRRLGSVFAAWDEKRVYFGLLFQAERELVHLEVASLSQQAFVFWSFGRE